jgi:hypothetical protein
VHTEVTRAQPGTLGEGWATTLPDHGCSRVRPTLAPASEGRLLSMWNAGGGTAGANDSLSPEATVCKARIPPVPFKARNANRLACPPSSGIRLFTTGELFSVLPWLDSLVEVEYNAAMWNWFARDVTACRYEETLQIQSLMPTLKLVQTPISRTEPPLRAQRNPWRTF